MEDWKTKLDAFLRFNDAEVLQDKGKVTAAIIFFCSKPYRQRVSGTFFRDTLFV